MTSDAYSRPWRPSATKRSVQISSLSRFQGRGFWLFPLAGLALFAVYMGLLFTAPMNDLVQRQIISEAGQILSLLFTAVMCFWVSTRVPAGRSQWAWRCLALAFASYFVGEWIFGINGIIIFANQSTPTPTWADAFYLPFYPLMAAGLLLLPSTPLSGSSRLRTIVEACITSAALLGMVLIYLIGPTFLQAGLKPISIGVLVAYPVGDAILILTLIFLLSRGVQSNYQPVFFFLTLGMLPFIYADISFNYLGLQNAYTVGAVYVDPFWALGEMVMGFAPLFFLVNGDKLNPAWTWLYNLAPHNATTSLATSIRRFLLPYISVLLLVILLAVNHPFLPGKYLSLEILTLAVVVLIVVRQILIGLDLVDAQVEKTRAQQLDSLKNQFITSVNHELRTPLMTMQAYVELLRIQQAQMKPADREIIIEEVGRTNDALVDLVQSILEVRRLDQESTDFPREAVPVRAVLEKAVALINPNEGRISERNLRAQAPRDLAIWGEPVRVQQILTNLISNAIKYSAPGTAIEVTASLAEMNQRGRWRRRHERPMVEITVRDHGLGIPPDQIPLLFNRFVRLPRDLASKVVGSGLGLFLCKTLTEAMDGRIWVESTGVEGEGSTFHVLLPAASSTTSYAIDKETTLPRPIVQVRA
jgi:signal transduction histidine kinase